MVARQSSESNRERSRNARAQPKAKSPNERAPEVLDRKSLEAKALSYLDRFDASANRLQRILADFVKRRARALDVDPAPFMAIVVEMLDRYQKNGLVDDRRYGATMARGLVERGVSRQAIRTKLYARGITASVIDEVVNELSTNDPSEVSAARALVKKRSLGNYRPESERHENYRRDLGILARAGFDFETAKRALAVEAVTEDEF